MVFCMTSREGASRGARQGRLGSRRSMEAFRVAEGTPPGAWARRRHLDTRPGPRSRPPRTAYPLAAGVMAPFRILAPLSLALSPVVLPLGCAGRAGTLPPSPPSTVAVPFDGFLLDLPGDPVSLGITRRVEVFGGAATTS